MEKHGKMLCKKVLQNLCQWQLVYERLKEARSMNFLKALGIGLATYLGMVLAVILVPVLVLLALWMGLCAFSAIFLFFFWLLVTHNPHTLHSSLYMLAWGAPPCMGFSVLGFYYGQLRARRKAPILTLRQDVPFS
jgi:hypothetical protein